MLYCYKFYNLKRSLSFEWGKNGRSKINVSYLYGKFWRIRWNFQYQLWTYLSFFLYARMAKAVSSLLIHAGSWKNPNFYLPLQKWVTYIFNFCITPWLEIRRIRSKYILIYLPLSPWMFVYSNIVWNKKYCGILKVALPVSIKVVQDYFIICRTIELLLSGYWWRGTIYGHMKL